MGDPHDDDLGAPDHEATAAHENGMCCAACGFSAELERSGTPPPTPGAPLRVPFDERGVPRGLSIVVREKGRERDADVIDVTTPEVKIGRVKGNDVVLPKGNISKRQSTIAFRDGQVFAVDGGSGCGTFVNGRRIHGPQVLHEADKIYIGDFTLELVRIPT